MVTQSPRGLNIERNDASTDDILPLGIAQRWPVKTYMSLKERAHSTKRRGSPTWHSGPMGNSPTSIRTKSDLKVFLERRKNEPEIVAGLLSLEGSHALEGDPANVDVLFAGVPDDVVHPFLRQRDGGLGAWRGEGRPGGKGPPTLLPA